MKLKHLTDTVLRSDSKKAALLERKSVTNLLHYINEVDRRKLYCDWKFTSLFDWSVRELGLCEGSAQLRITAARILNEVPEIEQKIQDGVLTLTNIAQVNRYCRENKVDTKLVLTKVENLSKKEAEKLLFKMSGKEVPAREGHERISKNKLKVTYILSDETLEAINEVSALIGGNMSKDELLKLMAGALKEKVEKEKFKQVKKPRKSKGTQIEGRVISAVVKRQVYARDQKCTNCGSIHNLNFDHIRPHALGGDNTLENIRLLCFQCNQRAWLTLSG
jgi:hypothetical protein